jgi:excinuclease ABC subunit A
MTEDLRAEVMRRLTSLRDAGLDYLTLDRPAASLSGGEAQRVRLASQLRSGLTGITYVLDEPTIGLHPRDTSRLIALLRGLRDAGNTILVVEHDIDVIAAADHILEIGPGAGDLGGQLIAHGPPAIIARDSSSRTGRCLRRPDTPRAPVFHRALKPGVSVRGATIHNLSGLDVDVPAGGLVVVTGVSGSGKSSLVFDVLAPSVERALAASPFALNSPPLDIAHGDPVRVEGSKTENGGRQVEAPVNCDAVILHTSFRAITRVEQASVGSSPWSTPATHAGVFDHIRDVFARTDAARARGLRKQQFSALGRGGRCEACEGLGETRVSMDFLPDVGTTCEDCGGKRYGPDVLACEFEGRSIADVLDMSIDEARVFFSGHTRIERVLSVLRDVGLGYVRLGQPARTLSGGERQRLVLATALLDSDGGPTVSLRRTDNGASRGRCRAVAWRVRSAD